MDSPPLEVFKAKVDGAMNKGVHLCKVFLPMMGRLGLDDLPCPFQPKSTCDSMESRKISTLYLEMWLCLAEAGNTVAAFPRYFQTLLFLDGFG